jgi:hypothetical protein
MISEKMIEIRSNREMERKEVNLHRRGHRPSSRVAEP